jgi:hypothetical protein
MRPRLDSWYLDIPVLMIACVIIGGLVAALLAAAFRAPRRVGIAATALVAMFVTGCAIGSLWLLWPPVLAAGAWGVGIWASARSRIRLGTELLAAGVYPAWMPWSCPRCDTDCREAPEPCPEAHELLHPSAPPPPLDLRAWEMPPARRTSDPWAAWAEKGRLDRQASYFKREIE